MATANAQTQADELPQQPANKCQQSTKLEDMWRRSTQAWSDSKERYHQATVEAWHRSSDSLSNTKSRYEQNTADAWHRSSNSVTSSKDRCHQSTMDAWQRSTDTWKNSKTRCRQSAAEMLNRSAVKLYQSTDRLQNLSYTPNNAFENHQTQIIKASQSTASLPSSLHQQPSLPAEPSSQNTQWSQPLTSPKSSPNPQLPQKFTVPESPQTSQSSQSSESPISSNSSQSAHPLSECSTDTMPPKYQLIDPSSKDQQQELQIRELLNMTDNTFFQLHQAKQLRNSKSGLLGEIEHQWINSTINDALQSGQSLVKLLEPHRLDMVKRKGKITSSNKKRWKNEDCLKAYEKQSNLILHQERLDKVFTHLKNLSPAQTSKSGPDSNELHPRSFSELEAARKPTPELTGDTERTSGLIELQAPIELPSDSVPQAIIAELPGDATSLKTESAKPVPKIIITRTPENISVEYIGSPATPDQPRHENDEINQILGWKQTRNDVRLHQSTSLSNIIAEMDNARIH
ncbi:hypothetical protein N7481_010909 [Penicillium waksmanii]|uniref:uncharacterized protein n=1 Tax=Penicillium waksmanii TaxID=69791 RepID=UPI002549120F|nr:uncharacterized protein N7481_010909 [Penicillium waksmanii]KAJ5973699.1 hypothetical protein N7481_010909 [Penicillium waksmanii]